MTDLLTAMAEAHHNQDVGGASKQTWEVLPEFVRADLLDNMKAALEVLKGPPAGFLEAMVEHMYAMSRRCDLRDTYLDETDMQGLLTAAIDAVLQEKHSAPR